MKKILGILFLSFLLIGCGEINKVEDLKKETFNCTGKGGQGKVMNVVFDINPQTKTLTFRQDGSLIGNIIKYPIKIVYKIKSSSESSIETGDYTHTWTNLVGKDLKYISYISTFDKKTWYYNFRQSKGDGYKFKNCKKIK